MPESIGIIAGQGQFPALIAQEARLKGYRVAIAGFHGHTDPALAQHADVFVMLYLGQVNRLIHFFQEQQVQRLCLAGAISKPRALDLRPDFRAARLLFSLRSKGDDVILRTLVQEFEKEGLHVEAAADLAPGLRSPQGVLSAREPSPEEWADIRYGWPICRLMGSLDIGQSLVVREGMVMAVECLEGTDATFRRGAELGGAGCTAIKMVKPGQDERVDLPALGLETIRTLAAGKFSCLALCAGKTIFFDRSAALQLANQHKIAIVALEESFMAEVSCQK